MRFADLKNDFVFRRVFGNHPELMTALLNDLLGLTGDDLISDLEYLSSEQAPEVAAFKLSIVDVKCRQKSGRQFVVEMQLAHFSGFDKRAVYNTSKAYVQQLPQGGKYPTLADVVGVSICNFEVFPDRERERQGLVKIPMVSRWKLTEQQTGASDALPQIQLVFLELPKLDQAQVATSGAAVWAWLFREARGFDAIPAGMPQGAYVRALELANEATFTEAEREAYRHVQDEIDVALDVMEQARTAEARGLARGLRDGKAEGLREGKAEGLRTAILDFCELLGITVSPGRAEQLASLSVEGLEALRAALKVSRAWPD
jgi:predicted transposase/invertase (TIGR01784 family)